jgi:hypothetical protein
MEVMPSGAMPLVPCSPRKVEAGASAAPGAGADRRDGHGHGGSPRLLGRADERQSVRCQLEQCCGRDTEGMVWIVDALRWAEWA